MGPGFYVISSVSPLSVWPIFSAVSVCLSVPTGLVFAVTAAAEPPACGMQRSLQYSLSSGLALLGFDALEHASHYVYQKVLELFVPLL